MGFYQTVELLFNKENKQQREEIIYRMEGFSSSISTSDKRFMTRTYEELKPLSIKKKNSTKSNLKMDSRSR